MTMHMKKMLTQMCPLCQTTSTVNTGRQVRCPSVCWMIFAYERHFGFSREHCVCFEASNAVKDFLLKRNNGPKTSKCPLATDGSLSDR